MAPARRRWLRADAPPIALAEVVLQRVISVRRARCVCKPIDFTDVPVNGVLTAEQQCGALISAHPL
jgi:hypothetical protein